MRTRAIGVLISLFAAVCFTSWGDEQDDPASTTEKAPARAKSDASKPVASIKKPAPPTRPRRKIRPASRQSARRRRHSSVNTTPRIPLQFTWVFSRATRSTTITGTYSLDQDRLTLSDPKRGDVAGQLTLGDDNSFTFHFVGTPQGQGELVFRR